MWKPCSMTATLPRFGSTFGSIRSARPADRLAPRRREIQRAYREGSSATACRRLIPASSRYGRRSAQTRHSEAARLARECASGLLPVCGARQRRNVRSHHPPPDAGELESTGLDDALREASAGEPLALAIEPSVEAARLVCARPRVSSAVWDLGPWRRSICLPPHARPGAPSPVLDGLGSPAATPGSQSNSIPAPPEPASAGAAESEPGPGTFGLHQQ